MHIQGHVSGPTGQDLQIMKRFLQKLLLYYRLSKDDTLSETVKTYCYSLFTSRVLQRYREYKDLNLVLVGHGVPACDDSRSCFNDDRRPNTNLRLHDRCIFQGKVLHSILYTRPKRTNDTFIQLTDKRILQINGFYSGADRPFLVGQECNVERVKLMVSKTNDNNLHLCKIIKHFSTSVIIEFNAIECKMMFIKYDEESYLCPVVNNVEIQ